MTVKAFSGGGEIGRVSQQVDNSRTEFGAFLTSPREAISRVVVHVCHHPVGADAPANCGEPDVLGPPLL